MSQTNAEPERRSTTGTPRWVKVLGIIAIVLVLLFVILHLTGNDFGFGMHMMPSEHSTQQP